MMPPRPALIVCREVRGRVLLVSPTDHDVHALLHRAGIPSADHYPGRTVRAGRLPDARAAAEAAGWHVVDSRARRAADRRAARATTRKPTR